MGKRRSRRDNPRLCPELQYIGFHVTDVKHDDLGHAYEVCRHCQQIVLIYEDRQMSLP